MRATSGSLGGDAINAAMFVTEMTAGSQALQADALDFFGDTLTYGLSLAVIGDR